MKKFKMFAFALVAVLLSLCAYAQATDTPTLDFLTQFLNTVKGFGGLTWAAKVSSIIMLLVASMKVSVLNDLIWKKFGEKQVWVAPLLGLVGGLLVLGFDPGSKLTLAGVLAYVTAGAGAVYLHEILDLVKAIPGLGSAYVALITLIENSLPSSIAKN